MGNMECPKCGSGSIIRKGTRHLLNEIKQRYMCKSCRYRFTHQYVRSVDTASGPRILIMDVETLPMLVYTFSCKVDYISSDKIVTPTILLSWAAKWLNGDEIFGDVLTPEEALSHDDSRICASMYALLCKADMVVAYNGVSFDFKKLNYRFIVNKLKPPTEYRTIDPYVSIRNQFGFDSNALTYVNRSLGIEEKTHTDFQCWVDCFNGKQEALDNMLKYNQNDVKILQDNYLQVRPWMKNHPNVGTYYEKVEGRCRVCGSPSLERLMDKGHYTNTARYALYVCRSCGAESTGRQNELDKDKMKGLVK